MVVSVVTHYGNIGKVCLNIQYNRQIFSCQGSFTQTGRIQVAVASQRSVTRRVTSLAIIERCRSLSLAYWCLRNALAPFSPGFGGHAVFATSTAQLSPDPPMAEWRSDAVAAGRGFFELQYAHPLRPLPGLRARPLPVGEVAERNTP
jgi:hypothetical protein